MRYVRLTIDMGYSDNHPVWGEKGSLRWWVWFHVKEMLRLNRIGKSSRLVSIEEISKKEFLAERKKK